MNVLAPAAARLFRLGAKARLWGYRRGLLKTRSLSYPVISVGNLSVGGTGKSPLVAYLAGLARELGFAPAILSRGYKGKAESSNLLVSDGARLLAEPEQAGDEPYMLAAGLPSTPVGVGRDRWRTGKMMEERLPDPKRLFILDDGFQHLRLHRNLDLVSVDATAPLASEPLLPQGRLREPVDALRRADAVLLTRSHLAAKRLAQIEEEIRSAAPCIPTFRFCTELVEGVWFPDGTRVALEEVARRQAVALAAIGNPGQFLGDLGRSGMRIINEFLFPDHHPYSQDEIDRILQRCELLKADLLVTTEKDAVRLRGLELHDFPTLVLRIRFQPEAAADFREWLATRLSVGQT